MWRQFECCLCIWLIIRLLECAISLASIMCINALQRLRALSLIPIFKLNVLDSSIKQINILKQEGERLYSYIQSYVMERDRSRTSYLTSNVNCLIRLMCICFYSLESWTNLLFGSRNIQWSAKRKSKLW